MALDVSAAGTPGRGRLALVVPGDVAAPTGGNVWDRRVRDGLAEVGVDVAWYPVDGAWPSPAPRERRALERVLAALPDTSSVLLDGLVACGVPDVVAAHRSRLRLGVVVHLPLALETGTDPEVAARLDAGERRVLADVDVVVVTSRWTASLLGGHGLARPPVVALPGTEPPSRTGSDPAAPVQPYATEAGSHLLCLGALSPRKGQRLLLRALAGLPGQTPGPADPPGWSARFVGPQPDPVEAADLLRERDEADLAGRVQVLPPLVDDALEEQWRWADLLVVPSHVESFGMVVTEALARGRPVLATTGGALPEALGTTGSGPPGLLVPPGGAAALQQALERWLGDAGLREELRRRALERSSGLDGWDCTARAVAAAFA